MSPTAKSDNGQLYIKVVSIEGHLINPLYKLEFFVDGQIIANDEIPCKLQSLVHRNVSVEEIEKVMDQFWKTPNHCSVEYREFPDGSFNVRFHKKDLAQAVHSHIYGTEGEA